MLFFLKKFLCWENGVLQLAQAKLQEWLKGVVSNSNEVRILKTWVKTPLCLEARSVISSSIHPRELNLDWLNKLNFKEASI